MLKLNFFEVLVDLLVMYVLENLFINLLDIFVEYLQNIDVMLKSILFDNL